MQEIISYQSLILILSLLALSPLHGGEKTTMPDAEKAKVTTYFDAFPKDVKAIGDHTWNNGYNGIACGEYYLRTGDKSVLPIMQHLHDDAKARQKFDCGWTHWSNGVPPGYDESTKAPYGQVDRLIEGLKISDLK